MLNKLFGNKNTSTFGKSSFGQSELGDAKRMRATAGSASADMAADLLTAPTALMQLSKEEAKVVVSYMKPRKIAEGTQFIKEGDKEDTGYMLLVLDGEVTVETIVVSRVSPITVTVLGAGSLIGEMGLIDGSPRAASCTATAELRCAVLTREALEQLMNDEPIIGGKFVMCICMRISERMRDVSEKLKLYTQLTQAMQQEIDKLMPT